jgi:hypothetical protein
MTSSILDLRCNSFILVVYFVNSSNEHHCIHVALDWRGSVKGIIVKGFYCNIIVYDFPRVLYI